ncbi:MAG TPA: hypothetical protein VMY38_09485 [Gemmatimonadaceae bacterium]|nr:hypothetical protein [Gemmatimonadaceae bacterium]
MLFPFALLGLVELGLRVADPRGGLPLFEQPAFVSGDYLVASRSVGQRWFGGIRNPPTAAPEPFARVKPARSFRVFVLGESTTAGFPYPRNVTFSRYLRDALRDAMPGDSVEVVNLGIAATNSFAMLDMAGEIARQRPDAVLIYAGHNEFYGALGAASRVSAPGGPLAVRLYLRLLRLRTVQAMRGGLAKLRGGAAESAEDLEAASLMEVLARDREVPLSGELYRAGLSQFERNLSAISGIFRERGIPVFIGSLASNLRDQPPFAAETNRSRSGAVAAYDSARAAAVVGDSASAARLFSRARDLDVVRFRAPAEFNEVIRRVAASAGATYVPVAEAFAAASPGGVPGHELLLEHVHPRRAGYALMGQSFFEALASSPAIRSRMDTSRVRSWADYEAAMALTPFDERVARHTVNTLIVRWPFVPAARQSDYRATYVPVDLLDSLAFAVSRGASWEQSKLRLASEYESRRQFDSAAAEYAGLARDAPLFAEPHELLARSLALAGRQEASDSALARAVAIRPTAEALARLGVSAVRRRALPEAISLLRRSHALQPNPDVLYQLSLAYGMANDLPNARATAVQLARTNPGHPGLADWLRSLGVQ